VAEAEPRPSPGWGLRIRNFLGRSENAVRIQIYIALIAFMLLRILHNTAARALKTSTALLLGQLKTSLFQPLDLRRLRETSANTSELATNPAIPPRLYMTLISSKNPGQQCTCAGTRLIQPRGHRRPEIRSLKIYTGQPWA
jgi:hypothetical protein